MKIVFLGTNGWYDTKVGDTVCTLIETKDFSVIFDAGNGIWKLDKYCDFKKPAFLFLSHFHLDHIFGLHILAKFKFKNGLTIFGQKGTKEMLKKIINSPFAVPISKLSFKVKIKDLKEGVHKVPFFVKCKFLLHADPVFGYQIELEGKKIAYCTDTGDCLSLRELAKNVDLLIAGTALPAGVKISKWPHLNPIEAAKIAKESKAKKLVLTHFSARLFPTKKERKLAERMAKKIFKNTIAAFDEMRLLL